MADEEFEIPPILKAEEFETLQDVEKKLYKEEDGQYVIRLKGGYQDTGALKRAKDHEKENAHKAQAALKKTKEELERMQKKMEDLEITKTNESEKVSEVEKNYIKKIKEIEDRMTANESKLIAKAQKAEKESLCNDVVSLFTNKKTSLPMIKERISFEIVDGESVPVYLDDNKNKTNWNLSEFKQNLLDDTELHDSLIGTRSKGSSASNSNNPRGSASTKLSQLSSQDIQKWMSEDPEGYMKALKLEQNQSKN